MANRAKPLLKTVGPAAGAVAVLAACPFFLPIYWTMILTEILIMALFAMSFNLLFGYTGLLSFGQGGFFGVGAYTVALLIGQGYGSLWVLLIVGIFSAAVVALIIGFLCVRL